MSNYLQIDHGNMLKGITSKVHPKYAKLTFIWKEPKAEAKYSSLVVLGVCVSGRIHLLAHVCQQGELSSIPCAPCESQCGNVPTSTTILCIPDREVKILAERIVTHSPIHLNK